MKVAAAAAVLGLVLFYFHHQNSGHGALPGYKTAEYEPSSPETDRATGKLDPKVGARKLEKLLATRYVSYPFHPRQCRPDRSKQWDYVCTDTVTGKRRGYDLDGSIVVSGRVR
jgi:hypothetical protein